MLKKITLSLTLLCLPACAQETTPAMPDGFAHATDYVPGLVQEIRYFGDNNFVGRPIDGYEAPECILSIEAAEALASAQEALSEFGLGLKVFDCYRPQRAVTNFAEWARDPDDTSRMADYYPNVPKDELFERGYIAERSGHSRECAVDLTIIDLATSEEIDMGSGYDLFDPLSWPSDLRPTADQRANRMLLQRVMVDAGFNLLDEEWWHFWLTEEPYPDTYFDFLVE